MQRSVGLLADVISFDYYHIMASPEWDIALRAPTNHNEPDWATAQLPRGWERPRWFANGSLDSTIRYLLAPEGSRARVLLWRQLEWERWLICSRSPARQRAKRALKARQLDGLPLGAALARGASERLWPCRAQRWLDRYQATACGERTRLADRDCYHSWWMHPYWRLLLSKYDIIQAYATFTAIPAKLGVPFVAYEHGTLRVLPFTDTAEGRACRESYQAASAVFVTNLDNIDAARQLKLKKPVWLPHAFDKQACFAFARAHRQIWPSLTTFIAPARHHWTGGDDPGWAKANNRVCQAAKLLAAKGRRFRLQFIEWGEDVAATRKLIADLGLVDFVEWLPPLPKPHLWARYLASAAVIDQFVIGGLGGVGFEALALGRRVISKLDLPSAREFFQGEAPPLLTAESVEEIAERMEQVLLDPLDRNNRGREGREWIERWHSADRQLRLQLQVYEQILKEEKRDEASSEEDQRSGALHQV